MSTKRTLVLALAAGFVGGIASQLIALAPVLAQSQTAVPTEIRAQSFVVMDETGAPRAAFGIAKMDGRSSANPFSSPTPRAQQPIIEATEEKGHLHWINLNVGRDMIPEKGTPTLLPPQ